MKNKLATLSILVHDRQNWSEPVNKILSSHAPLIISRLGVNLQRQCIEDCKALITIVAEGEEGKLQEMEKSLKKLENIDTKMIFFEL
jgi:metal-responsive CopG/Arc/MetJ family transcriptional regulator